jgi:hypothetical protein
MKYPESWYVDEEVPAPSPEWAAKVTSLGDFGKNLTWIRCVLAGPPWLRKAVGDTRKPSFEEEE